MKTDVGRYSYGEVDGANCNDSNNKCCGERETLEYGQRVLSMIGHRMASRGYSNPLDDFKGIFLYDANNACRLLCRIYR